MRIFNTLFNTSAASQASCAGVIFSTASLEVRIGNAGVLARLSYASLWAMQKRGHAVFVPKMTLLDGDQHYEIGGWTVYRADVSIEQDGLVWLQEESEDTPRSKSILLFLGLSSLTMTPGDGAKVLSHVTDPASLNHARLVEMAPGSDINRSFNTTEWEHGRWADGQWLEYAFPHQSITVHDGRTITLSDDGLELVI